MNTLLPIPLTSGSIEPSSISVMPSLPWGLLLDPYMRKYRWLRGTVSLGSTANGGEDDATWQLLRISL